MAKRVLYAAIHAWTSPLQVGSQAIAAQFAKNGWDVAYVSAPLTPLHWLGARGGGEYAWRIAEHRAGGGTDLDGRLWHYVPFALLAPDNRPPLRSTWLFENWHRLTTPNLPGLLRSRGFGEPDLLVLDTLFQPFWLDLVPHRRVGRAPRGLQRGLPRLWRRHAGGRAQDRLARRLRGDGGRGPRRGRARPGREGDPARAQRHRRLALRGRACRRSRRSTPGGAGPSRCTWARWPSGWTSRSSRPAPGRAPTSSSRSWDRARRMRPASPALANVHFLGRRAPETIPAYLRNADVGLIPFRSSRLESLIARVNPLKLYEYLAAGLPVVSTRWAELEGLASPARLCATTEEFVAALDEAIAAPGDPERLRAFARDADWSRRVAPLLDWAGAA